MKKKLAVAALPSSWLLPVMTSGCVMVRRTFPPLPSKITKPFQGNWSHLYFWTREGVQHNDGGSQGTRAYRERGLSVSFASDSQAARLVVFPNTHLGVAVKVCFFHVCIDYCGEIRLKYYSKKRTNILIIYYEPQSFCLFLFGIVCGTEPMT